jgi:hypothetical protein
VVFSLFSTAVSTWFKRSKFGGELPAILCYKILLTKLTSFQIVDTAIMNAGRIINRNKVLYGPGPLGRRPTGLGARPPLQGLVICAAQGIAVGLVGGLGYNVMFGNPLVNSIENYYKEHPSR